MEHSAPYADSLERALLTWNFARFLAQLRARVRVVPNPPQTHRQRPRHHAPEMMSSKNFVVLSLVRLCPLLFIFVFAAVLFFFFFFVSFRALLSEFTWSVAAFHSVSVEMRHKNLGFQYICGLLCPTDTRFLYYIQHYNYVRVPTCV